MAFYRFIYKLPIILKFIIGFAFCGPIGCILMLFLNIHAKYMVQMADIKEKCKNIKQNPNDKNVEDLINYLNKIDKQIVSSTSATSPEGAQELLSVFKYISNNNNVSLNIKENFLNYLSSKKIVSYKAVNVKNDNDNFNSAQHNFEQNELIQQEINRQNMEWAMEESRKAVTPFDMGGYVQGDGFNLSDTMVADAQREQMNQMNNMNMF